MKNSNCGRIVALVVLCLSGLSGQADSMIGFTHRGDRDPVASGWQVIGAPGYPTTAPGGEPAWALSTNSLLSGYRHPLTSAQADAARKYGWRLKVEVATDTADTDLLERISVNVLLGDRTRQRLLLGTRESFIISKALAVQVTDSVSDDTFNGDDGAVAGINTLELVQTGYPGSIAFYLNGQFRFSYAPFPDRTPSGGSLTNALVSFYTSEPPGTYRGLKWNVCFRKVEFEIFKEGRIAPAADFSLNGNLGGTAVDSVGGIPAQIVGAQSLDPAPGYFFDGHDSLLVPDHPDLEPGRAFTFSAWIRAQGPPPTDKVVASFFNKNSPPNFFAFDTYSGQPENLGLRVFAGDPDGESLNAGTWSNVMDFAQDQLVTMRFLDGIVDVFLNGNRVASDFLPNQQFIPDNQRSWLVGDGFVGRIYDVRFYNGALSDASIAAIHGLTQKPSTDPFSPRPESMVEQSVDAATGNFVHKLTALSVQGNQLLSLDLFYNSRNLALPTDFGLHWHHNYNVVLADDGGHFQKVRITFPNGEVHRYERYGLGLDYRGVGEAEQYDQLSVRLSYPGPIVGSVLDPDKEATIDSWSLVKANGRSYAFNAAGDLVGTADHQGNVIEVIRDILDPSLMRYISEPGSGQRLEFSYHPDGTMASVGDLLGRRVYFQYGSTPRGQLLSTITSPLQQFQPVCTNALAGPVYIPPEGLTYSLQITNAAQPGRVRYTMLTINPNAPVCNVTATLTSPSGVSTNLSLYGYHLITDAFVGQNTVGTWTLRIVQEDQSTCYPEYPSFFISFCMQVEDNSMFEGSDRVDLYYEQLGGVGADALVAAYDQAGNRLFANEYVGEELRGHTDALGHKSGFFYDTAGAFNRITTYYTNHLGAVTRYLHDGDYHLLERTDPLGGRFSYGYDSRTGNRTSLTDPLGRTTRFAYDSFGQLISLTDPQGEVTEFSFDNDYYYKTLSGTRLGNKANGNLASVRDATRTNLTTFFYDGSNKLKAVTNTLALSFQIETNLSGGSLAVNKAGSEVALEYQDGKLIGASGNGESQTYEYDAAGRLTATTDGQSNRFALVYNVNNSVIERRNALGQSEYFEYDSRGRRTRQVNRRGYETRWEHDANGNMLKMINALDQEYRYEYDDEDRLTQVIDPAGHILAYEYDALGRLTSLTKPLGQTTRFGYDALGNLIATTNAMLNAQTLTYDRPNRRLLSRDESGNETITSFDVLGQMIARLNPLGQETTFGYDALGRLSEVVDPRAHKTRNRYGSDDVLERIEDSAGAGNPRYQFTFDFFNRVESVTEAGGYTRQFTYDNTGNLETFTRPSGKGTKYHYDPAGRIVRTEHLYNGSPNPTTHDLVFEYDANGNLTKSGEDDDSNPNTAPVNWTHRTFDALDRLETEQNDYWLFAAVYTYNNLSLVKSIQYPDGFLVEYLYDEASRLTTVTAGFPGEATWVTRYVWNQLDQITSVTYPNSAVELREYDSSGRMTRLVHQDGSGRERFNCAYDYDALSRISPHLYSKNPEPPPLSANNSYVYDEANRLTRVNGINLSYDPDGNLISGPGGGFIWDQHNNLRSAPGNMSFQYDGEDKLKGWTDSSGQTRFTTVQTSAGAQILVKVDPAGVATHYVYGVGLIFEERSGGILVHHHDHAGNTVELSNETGRPVGQVNYDPYGKILSQIGQDTIFKFGGQFGVVTAPNGLCNMRFRWYHPDLKRFISEDSHLGSIDQALTLNQFLFAYNDPLNFADPQGETPTILIGVLVGAMVGFSSELVIALLEDRAVNWNQAGASAIAGGIAGGLFGAGNPSGLVGIIGTGAFAGLVEGAGAYALGKYFDGDRVDAGDLLLSAGTGATLGAFLGGAGGAQVARSVTAQTTRSLLSNSVREFGKGVASNVAQNYTELGLRAGASGSASLLADALRNPVMQNLTPSGLSGGQGVPPAMGRLGRMISPAVSGKAQYIGVAGEHQHWKLYLDALQQAGRPLPDLPSYQLPAF